MAKYDIYSFLFGTSQYMSIYFSGKSLIGHFFSSNIQYFGPFFNFYIYKMFSYTELMKIEHVYLVGSI